MDVEQASIHALTPDVRNPRRISEHDAAALRRSLREFGAVEPAVVNADGTIIGGHQRVEAARDLGWQEFPVLRVDLDDTRARLLNLALNRIHGEWDEDLLAAMLADLGDADADLALSGFADLEVDEFLAQADGGDPDRDTEAITPPAQPRTQPGDLYLLGAHRLLCGDCTDAGAVARLIDGAPVEMVWTDPPYGVALADVTEHRGGVDHGHMIGDERHATRALVTAALALAGDAVEPGGAVYCCHPETNGLAFREALAAAGWEHKQTLIWVKQSFVLGRQDYQWQHEPILYGWRPGAAHRWHGGFSESTVIDDDVDLAKLDRRQLVQLVRQLQNDRATTVIREDKPHLAELHPTVKPGGAGRALRRQLQPRRRDRL
jgi:hypothetical protein